MADLPHLPINFRFVTEDGMPRPTVVEQDSYEDIASCVETILRCPVDWRPELPEFGSVDPTFRQAPIDTDSMLAAVRQWEDRAEFTTEEFGDVVDEAVRRIRLSIQTEGQI